MCATYLLGVEKLQSECKLNEPFDDEIFVDAPFPALEVLVQVSAVAIIRYEAQALQMREMRMILQDARMPQACACI